MFIENNLRSVVKSVSDRIWGRSGRGRASPAVIWFTGLSGSGKSTLAALVCRELRGRGLTVEYLDGDIVRNIFPQTGFDKESRENHIRRVGFLASILGRNGIFVVASFISPYESSRRFVRDLCGNFIEIHVSTPLAACEERDPKGLYKKARAGEIKNFTGIDDPYEPPSSPELRVDTSRLSEKEALELVLATIDRHIQEKT